MVTFELMHIFQWNEDCLEFDSKGLGLYTSFERVQQAIQHYISQPGFCDYPEGFSVCRREVKGAVNNNEIFEALVYFHTNDYEYEYSAELGLFGDKSEAQEAVSMFTEDNKHLFSIQDLVIERIVNRCILDRKEWAEGFSASVF